MDREELCIQAAQAGEPLEQASSCTEAIRRLRIEEGE